VLFLPVDVTNETQFMGAIDSAIEQFGTIDIPDQ